MQEAKKGLFSDCRPPESDAQALFGTWELASAEIEYQDSGERNPMYSAPAVGFLLFNSDFYMLTVVEVRLARTTAPKLSPPPPGAHGMAYAGRWRLAGEELYIAVDAASLEGWTGSVQRRSVRVECGRLFLHSDWCQSPLHGNRIVRAWLVWQRFTAT